MCVFVGVGYGGDDDCEGHVNFSHWQRRVILESYKEMLGELRHEVFK